LSASPKVRELGIEKPKELFAFHYKSDKGNVDWCGDVVSQDHENISINVIDPVPAMAGYWWTTDDIKTVPIKECRVFISKAAALTAMHRSNERYLDNN
jgi:hypothetical protein